MSVFDLFKSKLVASLDEAVRQDIIAIRDIAGRDSWKGMDITLENLTRNKGVDVNIPAGTTFRERSGQLQQMMMVNPTDVHVPAGQRVTQPLDDAICTQPCVPAPPLRVRKIDDAMRATLTMSDEEYEKMLKKVIQSGRASEDDAEEARKARRHFLNDERIMTAIKQGKSEVRFDYSYSAAPPSSSSAADMAEAYLGIGVNLYQYSDKEQAVEMFKKAAQSAPQSTRPYYDKIYRFARTFNGKAGADIMLMRSCGSDVEREMTELIIDEALKSPSEDIRASSVRAAMKRAASEIDKSDQDTMEEPAGRHDYAYQKARKEFMKRSLDDPNVPDHIKGWIRQEMRERGEDGYWRSPPGYDVGHKVQGINSPDNFRWESADMNRSKGGKYHK